MKRKLGKKGFVFVLCTTLILGLIPTNNNSKIVKADSGTIKVRDANLGLGGIENPTAPSDLTSEWSNGTGSYVYFGSYEQDASVGKDPIKWNVLSKNTDSMLLLSNQVLDRILFNENTRDKNVWADSNIRKWLNSENFTPNDEYNYTSGGFLYTAFGTIEQTAIQNTNKIEDMEDVVIEALRGTTLEGVGLSEDKIFVLSALEAANTSYGFYGMTDTIANNTSTQALATNYAKERLILTGEDGKRPAWWWLRSSGSSDSYASHVDNSGSLARLSVNIEKCGVRPAFNLNSSSVLFNMASGTLKSDFRTVEDSNVDSNTWKLTLKGTDNTLSAEKTKGTTDLHIGYSAEQLTIGHDAAAILTDATQVSAMLTDVNGTVLYYGSINSDTSATSSTVTIPSGLLEGKYNLYVFAEDVNEGNLTDYATAFGTAIPITVSATSKTYSVTINAGNNMTKIEASGLANQTITSGSAMTSVIYTVNADYYIPVDYSVASSNGITVTRNSYAQITVSGTPTATTTITLKAATEKQSQSVPASLSDGAGKITGTTIDMEYALSSDASSWMTCTAGNTIVENGTWYVRYKATEEKKAGEVVVVTVTSSHIHSYASEWSSDDNNHWQECSCGDKKNKAAHTIGDWIIDTKATTTNTGSKHKKCTVCGKVLKTETIPVLDESHTHTYASEWSSDDNNHWHECICGGKNGKTVHTVGDWIVDTEATITSTGSKHKECIICGKVLKTELIPTLREPHTHAYANKWSSDDNSHWYECSCGNKNSKVAHIVGDWIVDTEATNTSTGSKHKECTSCGKVLKTEIIAKLENEKKNINDKNDKNDVSKTGDSNSVRLWFIVFSISGIGITYLCIRRKKNQTKF